MQFSSNSRWRLFCRAGYRWYSTVCVCVCVELFRRGKYDAIFSHLLTWRVVCVCVLRKYVGSAREKNIMENSARPRARTLGCLKFPSHRQNENEWPLHLRRFWCRKLKTMRQNHIWCGCRIFFSNIFFFFLPLRFPDGSELLCCNIGISESERVNLLYFENS